MKLNGESNVDSSPCRSTKSAPGTYFCVCGFNKGYFGIQELANSKKLVLFSVWDPSSGNDAKKVPESKRVQMLHKEEDVRVGRFGGEGTGGQAFFDYDWKADQTYRFCVTAEVQSDERTAYTGYFYLPETKEWKKLVTFSALSEGKPLGGYYSFVEDFRRNKISASKTRHAEYGNGWVKPLKGDWQRLNQAKFTADSNPAENIDAGPLPDKHAYFLATGGELENKTVKLRQSMKLDGDKWKLPTDLPVK